MNLAHSLEVIDSEDKVLQHPESRRPNIHVGETTPDGDLISIPHSADTTYLAHGYYRYIGKYPPQIVSYLINTFDIQGPILDPMVGGGTTLTEAKLRGIDAVGCDINPVSRLVSKCVSGPVAPEEFESDAAAFMRDLGDVIGDEGLFAKGAPRLPAFPIKFCREYFSEETLSALTGFHKVVSDYPQYGSHYYMSLFAVLRKISRANIKKMNLEIDERRTQIPSLLPAFGSHLREVLKLNRDYSTWAHTADISVIDASADDTGLPDDKFGAVFLHPPYLTNTAFSEFTQLQLALLGINHKDIWKRELRCRGSFLHESNGLKKYIVGWKRTMIEAVRVLRPGGTLVTVIGDGQIDYVRIPLGAITVEFGRDLGLTLERRLVHMLNNHTGQTQSRKMSGQHIAVFRKTVKG